MPVSGAAWIDKLPTEMSGQRRLLRGLLSFCEAERTARWLVLGCSVARGAGDYLSDLDMAIGVQADDFAATVAQVHQAVDSLADLVESYQHQLPSVPDEHARIFAQYSDRSQLDLVVFPAAYVRNRPLAGAVALYDPDAVITTRPYREPPTPAQVREWAFHGWCTLADAGKYLRRGSAWEVLGRLDNARDQLWRLHAVAGGVPDPQFGLTSILDFAPDEIPAGLAATVTDLDPARQASAALQIAAGLDEVGRRLPDYCRADLPEAMARYVLGDLRAVSNAAASWSPAPPG
jgi:hypothetical protein